MARPVQRKAQKDYPGNNIKKGELYWYVKIKTGPRSSRTMRQKEPFKPSQLTSSEFLSQLYTLQEEQAALSSMDDAQELADSIRALGEEEQGKYDNMPDGLQQGDTGQLLEERANACEQAASEIEDIIADWESDKEDHEEKETEYEEYQTALEGWDEDSGDPEPDEVNDPGEFDESEYIDRVKDVEISL